jgi:hypothetical protein
LAVQWLNQALCFYQSSCLADSFVLRNRQLLEAAKRYGQSDHKLCEGILNGWLKRFFTTDQEKLQESACKGQYRPEHGYLDPDKSFTIFNETKSGISLEDQISRLRVLLTKDLSFLTEDQKNEVGIIVKIPLDSGWLSGKYNAKSTFTDIRSRWSTKDIETRAELVTKVKAITATEVNLAQMAIAFCLAYEAVSTVIPGNVDVNQLSSNVKSTDIAITPSMLEKLEHFYHSEVKELNLPW